MRFRYDDGGRSRYFRAENVGDCVTRAIANATGIDYKEVYDALHALSRNERTGARKRGRSSPRNGVYGDTTRKYLEGQLGWVFVPCMGIGTGCRVHLRDGELPSVGSYVVRTSKHLTCVKDGVLVDTYDCSRDGERCVYGYWRAPTAEEARAHAESVAEARSREEAKQSAAADLKARRERAREANRKVAKSYAKRINRLKAQLRRLEREMESKMVPIPKE